MLATTSWIVDFASRSASLLSRFAFVTGDRTWASSTTRPVSAGNVAAAHAAPNASSARMAKAARLRTSPSAAPARPGSR